MTVSLSSLRPFFGFYGGKWRDALKHYPPPAYDTIVEPFAGSAGYAVRYAAARVVLCELDPILCGIWRYLVRASAADIRAIPDLPEGGTIDDLPVCQEARWLVGMWLNRASTGPRRSASAWMRSGVRPGSFWGQRVRETIASQVDAIRHWQVHEGSYETCPFEGEATWFVDPPYQLAGTHYRFGSGGIDFEALGAWCASRLGQVIVCEAGDARWLPFRPLAAIKTTRRDKRSVEAVWLSEAAT